jgi:hypothetical protein
MLFGEANQLAELAVDAGQVADNLRESYHAEAGGINDRLHALSLQSRSGAAIKMRVRVEPF